MSSGPSPDAKLSAVSGMQVAIIGGIAGLITALVTSAITVPLTIWSTKKAGEDAINTVKTQLAGETDKSRAEFLRGQRQVLYSDVVRAERALSDAEFEQWNSVHAYAFEGGRKPNLKKFSTAYARWHNYDAIIQVLGSTDIVDTFETQAKHHHTYVDAAEPVIYFVDCMRNPSLAKGTTDWRGTPRKTKIRCKERRQRYIVRMLDLSDVKLPEDRANFIKYARLDLG